MRRTLVPLFALLVGVAGPGHAYATRAPAARAAPDSVRQLDVLLVVYTKSFSRELTPAQVERLDEEMVEFADFYRRHGGSRVAFRFSLLQVDRPLRRDEVDEVAPGKYYLSREDVERELDALGADTLGVDEVVAFYAWNDANPDGAALAYGGAAVGPDGHFLGDAGYNAIGVFAWNPGRIAQVAVHEMLHNLDDMFSRSGMADTFLNPDEMSRNMPTLLRERPGLFRPYYTDAEMLAFARREKAGREMYPWWMQRLYYAWMLERTPAGAWNGLRYGRMARRAPADAAEPLFADAGLAAATRRFYDSVLAPRDTATPATRALSPLVARIGGQAVPLAPRQSALEDFDGTPLVREPYHAGWVDLPPGDSRIEVAGAVTRVRRLPQVEIVAPTSITAYREDNAGRERGRAARDTAGVRVQVTVRMAGWPAAGPVLDDADVRATDAAGHTLTLERVGSGRYAAVLPAPPAGRAYRIDARAPGRIPAHVNVRVRRRPDWSVAAPATLETPMGMPFNVRVAVREDRALEDARVSAAVVDTTVVLEPAEGGGYTANVGGMRPGMHDVVVRAQRPGEVAVDTVRVYVKARGWIRVPRRVAAAAGRPVELTAVVRSRMGEPMPRLGLPLVAIVGDLVVPFTEDAGGVYRASLHLARGRHRVYVTSLTGEFQRRVVLVDVGRGTMDRTGGVGP
ncbi:MAG TPA: hypothetical protein VJ957_07135 [Longimicrobiales bacterium]|nr:hypothetical protein [Longimicrobiales bacterium]